MMKKMLIICVIILLMGAVSAPVEAADTYILRYQRFGEYLGYDGTYKHLMSVYVDGMLVHWDDVSEGQDSGPKEIDVTSAVTNPDQPEVIFRLHCNSSVSDFPVQINVSEIELTKSGELINIGSFRYDEGTPGNNYQGSNTSGSLQLRLPASQAVSSGDYAQFTSGYPKRILSFTETTTLPNNWPIANRHIFKVLVDGQQVYSLDVGDNQSAGSISVDLTDTDFDPATGQIVFRLYAQSSALRFPITVEVSDIAMQIDCDMYVYDNPVYDESPASSNYDGTVTANGITLFVPEDQGMGTGHYGQFTGSLVQTTRQCGVSFTRTPGLMPDFTLDCQVNFDDLLVLAEQFFQDGSSTADVNRDGHVDLGDFAELSLLWLDSDDPADPDSLWVCPRCTGAQIEELVHYPGMHKALVPIFAYGCGGALSNTSVNLYLVPAGGGNVVATGTIETLEDDFMVGTINYEGVAPGDYNVEVELREGSGLVMTESLPLTIEPDPVWLGNDIGILPAGTVPAPWTNMSVNGTDVSCWGRTYSFANGLFPSQITTAGNQILYEPIRLTGTVGGSPAMLTAASVQITSSTNDRVELSTSAMLGTLPVRTETWIEYDGLCWIKLYLEPNGAVNVSSLKLEIPMDIDYATLFCSDRRWTEGTGAIQSSWGGEWAQDTPRLWMGDEQGGLQWMAESMKNWHLYNPYNSLSYYRYTDEVVITIKFIDTNTQISEPTEIEFGLIASPVKPKPAGWRSWRFGGGDDPDPLDVAIAGPIGTNYDNWFDYWFETQRWVSPVPNAQTQGRIDALLSQGIYAMPYYSLTWMGAMIEEYAKFGDEWHEVYRDFPDIDATTENDWSQVPVCPQARSYVDWYIWSIDQTISDLGLHGMYFDMSMQSYCASHFHGCGYQNIERPWPPMDFDHSIYGPAIETKRSIDKYGHYFQESKILATRDMRRRYYNMAKAHDPDFLIMYHTSGDLGLEQNAYVSTPMGGENFGHWFISWGHTNYYEALPLDMFRAELMGHNMGFVGSFLPEFRGAYTEKEVRHLLGMILLHDSKVVPAYTGELPDPMKPFDDIRSAQDEFGQWDDNMDFLPYWDNTQYITVSPSNSNLVCSVFRGSNKVMLVPFNNTDSNISTTVTLNFANLGISGTQLRDMQTDEVFTISGSSATFNMPYRDYRILLVETP